MFLHNYVLCVHVLLYNACLACSNTHNAVKQTAALCLLKMLRVNPKAIPIDQHAAKIVQLINDKHLVSSKHTLLPMHVCMGK